MQPLEIVGFLLVFVLPWWLIENRHLFLMTGERERFPSEAADWLHSVPPISWQDPTDAFRAGYIDKYEYAKRMIALKRYVTLDDLVKVAYAEPLVRDIYSR